MKIKVTGLWLSLLIPTLVACTKDLVDISQVATGKQIAFERRKGNCLACHVIADGEAPGTIGQPLTALAARFENKSALRALIWDATRFNPDTTMPPFGRNKILTETEIDQVVDFLWTLE